MATPDQAESSMNGGAPIDRRFKLNRACDRCRRRRIKCDEGHPCKSCTNSNSSCTFEEVGKKSLPHKSKRSTLEERMQQIESFIHALPAGLFSGGGFDEPTTPIKPQSGSSTPLNPVAPSSLSSHRLINPSRFFPPLESSLGNSNVYEDATHLHQHSHAAYPVPLASSYLYLDDHGSTRWQGEMSGFPLLDILIEHREAAAMKQADSPASSKPSPTLAAESEADAASPTPHDWFPDRKRVQDSVRPEDVWMMIANVIQPDLMDNLVLLWLKTTYYLMPFIHIPSFLADYPNPNKWDAGFGSFIVAICCLTSRHVDDPRVRSDPKDNFSAGAHFFDLFMKLRSLPGADRPTLYTVQSVLLVAVYALGRGRLSKGLALLSESITLCVDAGLHRSVDHYDHFDPIETEVRKRTFWAVYAWDKQAAIYFGRPPMIRLRDCDVPEPELVDDDYITRDALGTQPPGKPSLMTAFVATNRLYIVIEGVLDVHPIPRPSATPTSFLSRATSALSGFRQSKDLKEAEALVDEWCTALPTYWAVTAETMASRDVIRITQAERLHCLEHFVRMLIHRYRFSLHIANPGAGSEQAKEAAMKGAQRSALQIIAKHLEISSLGLMTYYGLFVIHQLTQAGRTLIAILLECKSDHALMASSLEALKACVGLLRRFSGRYVCGLRSADLLEETCRLNRIPLEIFEQPAVTSLRPAWLRPVRKRVGSRATSSDQSGSPAPSQGSSDAFFKDLFETGATGSSIVHPTEAMGLAISQSYQQAPLPMTGGGLLEPLSQGSLAPLTAEMFGGDNDLLAYLTGGMSGSESGMSMDYSLLPTSPISFAADVAMTPTTSTPSTGLL